MNEAYIQGDVPFRQIEKLPNDAKLKTKDTAVAYGEVTGHSHRLVGKDARVYEGSGGLVYAVLEAPAQLVHEEHPPILLQPGVYEFGSTREYQWGQERRVLD